MKKIQAEVTKFVVGSHHGAVLISCLECKEKTAPTRWQDDFNAGSREDAETVAENRVWCSGGSLERTPHLDCKHARARQAPTRLRTQGLCPTCWPRHDHDGEQQ